MTERRSLFPSLRQSVGTVWSATVRFVVTVFGPDRRESGGEDLGWLQRLLPWWLRVLATVAILLVTLIWSDTPPAPQLSWGLAYAGAVAVSLASSNWGVAALISLGLGVPWLLLTLVPPPERETHPILWFAQQAVEFLNRQVSHIEAFWIWMAAVMEVPRLWVQLPGLAVLILLGASIVNGFTAWLHPQASKASGQLQAARRPAIYVATMIGLLIVVLRSWDAQIYDLLPLAMAIGLGAALRGLRHRIRRLRVEKMEGPDRESVQRFRAEQRRLTRRADVALGPMLAVASLIGVIALSALGRQRFEATHTGTLDGPAAPRDACVPEQGGPVAPQVTMFLASDSHSHELGGKRFPGQTELADALATSALRPVEQDMLSTVTVKHFGRWYNDLVKQTKTPVFWAHLGDLTDLSCTGELQRAFASFSVFPAAELAGVASGNHDTTFTGNFSWSPFWSDACRPTARMDKAVSLNMMKDYALRAGITQRKAGQVAVIERSNWPRWLGGSDGAIVTLTPLGAVTDRGRQRGLVAIFIDSTDGQATNWGIAGLYGSFSADQDRKLRQMIAKLPDEALYPYQDPIWLVFSHHRIGDMASPSSQRRLNQFLLWLDRYPALPPPSSDEPWRDPAQGRTLAYITGHTHVAESHRHCVGDDDNKRLIREIVVGSMIDPPQQAAVLEIGSGPKGTTAARLRTLPAIGRPGYVCGQQGATLDAARCRQVIAQLKQAPACEPLFSEPTVPGPDCSLLERGMSTSERLRALLSVRGVYQPKKILAEQAQRARKLLGCVCRPDARGADPELQKVCAAAAAAQDPFKDGAATDFPGGIYADVLNKRLGAEGANGIASDTELTCLSWAAAAIEAYKAGGMTMATALRCAFDDTTLPAAQETVASLEVQRCQ